MCWQMCAKALLDYVCVWDALKPVNWPLCCRCFQLSDIQAEKVHSRPRVNPWKKSSFLPTEPDWVENKCGGGLLVRAPAVHVLLYRYKTSKRLAIILRKKSPVTEIFLGSYSWTYFWKFAAADARWSNKAQLLSWAIICPLSQNTCSFKTRDLNSSAYGPGASVTLEIYNHSMWDPSKPDTTSGATCIFFFVMIWEQLAASPSTVYTRDHRGGSFFLSLPPLSCVSATPPQFNNL